VLRENSSSSLPALSEILFRFFEVLLLDNSHRQINVAQYPVEGIIQLMSDLGSSLADGGESFGVGQLSLGVDFFRYIFDHDEAAEIAR